MGNLPSGGGDNQSNENRKEEMRKRRQEQRLPVRVGKKKKRRGIEAIVKIPTVTPSSKCRLKLLRQERIKDYMLLEQEFIKNQEAFRPQAERKEEEREKVDQLRGTPLIVGSLEEFIDENHAIISTSVGPEYYVSVLSIVDKDQLEPGSSVLLHNKSMSVVGILQDEVDPLVSRKSTS
jgi:26S proteasome regulatory subunit T2